MTAFISSAGFSSAGGRNSTRVNLLWDRRGLRFAEAVVPYQAHGAMAVRRARHRRRSGRVGSSGYNAASVLSEEYRRATRVFFRWG